VKTWKKSGLSARRSRLAERKEMGRRKTFRRKGKEGEKKKKIPNVGHGKKKKKGGFCGQKKGAGRA